MSLKIKTKLLLGPIILAIMILILGLIGIYTSRTQRLRFVEVGTIVPYLINLHELRYNQQKLISELNKLFNPSNNDEDFNKIFKELALSDKNYTWALRAISSFPKSPQELKLYNEFLNSNEAFYRVINRVIPNAKGRLKSDLSRDEVLSQISAQAKQEGTELYYDETQKKLNELLYYSINHYSDDVLISHINESNNNVFIYILTALIVFLGALTFAVFLSHKLNDLLLKQEKMSLSLSKYVSPQIYNSIFLGEKEVKVSSCRKNLTVFFSDIQGFTRLTDVLESETLTLLLNDYFNRMSKIAIKYGGTIDKFMGDAIMIFFGDPDTKGITQDALNCVLMGLEMRKCMKELKRSWESEGVLSQLKVRTGISSGYCTVGNFGSEDRLDYTIIGRNVNLASRLESSAEADEILISHQTYTMVKDVVYCEKREKIYVKGITAAIQTYRVVDLHKNMENTNIKLKNELQNVLEKIYPSELSDHERNIISKLLKEKRHNLKL